jgi:nicotinamide mononucleotide transporter
MLWTEAIATLFGLSCVVLTVRQSIWCWPAGLVQVALFCFVFWSAKLYSDLLLHVVYIGLQCYGWYHWIHGGGLNRTLPVSRLSASALAAWGIVVACGTLAVGAIMGTYTDAALPYPDAFIMVASLVAQWLLTRKVLESWLIWIGVDAVAIAVYWSRSLYFTTGLYAVFLGLAIAGFWAWKRSFRGISSIQEVHESWSHVG